MTEAAKIAALLFSFLLAGHYCCDWQEKTRWHTAATHLKPLPRHDRPAPGQWLTKREVEKNILTLFAAE